MVFFRDFRMTARESKSDGISGETAYIIECEQPGQPPSEHNCTIPEQVGPLLSGSALIPSGQERGLDGLKGLEGRLRMIGISPG